MEFRGVNSHRNPIIFNIVVTNDNIMCIVPLPQLKYHNCRVIEIKSRRMIPSNLIVTQLQSCVMNIHTKRPID